MNEIKSPINIKAEYLPGNDAAPITDGHFYAANLRYWRTNVDLPTLIKDMQSYDETFSLFFVPLPDDALYEISFWVPQVEGLVFLGRYK